MNILMLAINDPAGAAVNLCTAINTYTEHTARLVTNETRYNHNFKQDLHTPDLDNTQKTELEQLFIKSDIFHFHMTADENTYFSSFKAKDFLQDKIIVHHHHGHPDFRQNSNKYRSKYKTLKRENLLVSTPDLLKLLPEATWQPNTVPIYASKYLPIKKDNEILQIGQSPTRKELKNTAEFIEITNKLKQNTNLPEFKAVIIDNIAHVSCLKLKQNCDVFFDHIQGYFGMSSLEALSQGIPTIAGLDNWNFEHIENFAGCEPAWNIARNKQELEALLTVLLTDITFRNEKALQSREFMEKSWSDKKVARHLCTWYESI